MLNIYALFYILTKEIGLSTQQALDLVQITFISYNVNIEV